MATCWKCDRCGKIGDYQTTQHVVSLGTKNPGIGNIFGNPTVAISQKELCKDCYKEIKEVVESSPKNLCVCCHNRINAVLIDGECPDCCH